MGYLEFKVKQIYELYTQITSNHRLLSNRLLAFRRIFLWLIKYVIIIISFLWTHKMNKKILGGLKIRHRNDALYRNYEMKKSRIRIAGIKFGLNRKWKLKCQVLRTGIIEDLQCQSTDILSRKLPRKNNYWNGLLVIAFSGWLSIYGDASNSRHFIYPVIQGK